MRKKAEQAMKVVIFCGGFGTRLREETEFRPKPMVPIGGLPILWHIMKIYATHGHKDFILCLGYKGGVIKDYFRNYHWNVSDVTMRLGPLPEIHYHDPHLREDWTVTLLDTGEDTMTAGRLKRALAHIDSDTFLLSYGDGLTDSDINASVRFHQKGGAIATVTAVPLASRFGELTIGEDNVTSFREKPEEEGGFINGGFFVLDRRVAEYLPEEDCMFEHEPMRRLVADGQMKALVHRGYWQCMDTLRDQEILNDAWRSGNAPWKIW